MCIHLTKTYDSSSDNRAYYQIHNKCNNTCESWKNFQLWEYLQKPPAYSISLQKSLWLGVRSILNDSLDSAGLFFLVQKQAALSTKSMVTCLNEAAATALGSATHSAADSPGWHNLRSGAELAHLRPEPAAENTGEHKENSLTAYSSDDRYN